MKRSFSALSELLLLVTLCVANSRLALSKPAAGGGFWYHANWGPTYSVDSASPFSTYDFGGPFQPYAFEGDLIFWFSKALDPSQKYLYGPCTAIPAGPTGQGLGLTKPAEVDSISFGNDRWWPAWPMRIEFSVDRNAVGLPTAGHPPLPNLPGVRLSDVYNEAQGNEAAADIFVSGAYIGSPPIPPFSSTYTFQPFGWNMQWRDEDGYPLGNFSTLSCANLTVADNIDAWEDESPAGRDPNLTGTPGNTTVHLPVWGAGTVKATAGGPIFFSLDPLSAAANGVSPADILVSAHGTWWVFATASQLGLSQNDDIDALALSINPYLISPNMTFSPPIHEILYSVSPSSSIVGTTCPYTGRAIGPGDILTTGHAFGILQPRVMIFIPASGLGLASTDNLDALDTRPGLALTEEEKENLREKRPHGGRWTPPPPPPRPCNLTLSLLVFPCPKPQPGEPEPGEARMVPSPECRLPPLDSEFGREIANSIPRNFTEEYTIEISSDAYIFKGTKDMKESIVPIITAILPNVSEEVEEKLTTVIFYITESLTSEWWIDDSHLDPDNGDQVFEADNAAIKILSELVENYEHYDISLSTASELANALGALWKTDLELAETVYIEAGLAGCPDEAMNYVGKRLIEGHYSIDACDWAQASRGFHKAWREGAVAFYALVNGNIPSLFDPADDIYRDDGSYADGPEWQDITEVRVDRTDKVITFSLYVNDTFPTHETYWDGAIMILIDIDGDGEPVPSEGTIDFYGGNMDFGIFIPSPEFGEPPIFIEDLRLQGSGTPDTTGAQYSVEGNKIEVEVETEHVGAPEGRIGFVAAIRTGFTADLVEDRIPDKELAYEWPMIHVAILGDLNADNTVNIIDLTIVAVAFGSKPGDSKWNQIADMNNDEKINIIDITMVALEYGQTA